MNITITVDVKVTFYHKQTMKELVIDRNITKEYNEESEEYLNLCRERESDIGFLRVENKTKFDEILSSMLCDEAKEEWDERLNRIIELVRGIYKDDYLTKRYVTGYIELFGYVINPRDFCAVSVDRFDIKAIKR